MNPTSPRTASLGRIFGYALGEGAVSITMNGIANFAMLYYTQVLGLGAGYAGLALSITLLWDALTDPVMGHLTDNTRTRFGAACPTCWSEALRWRFRFIFFGPCRRSSTRRSPCSGASSWSIWSCARR